MMRIGNRRCLGALAILIITIPSSVQAAGQGPNGITVSPAYQEVSLKPNEASHVVDFEITNNQSVAQVLHISVADFNTLSESGGLYFVGANPSQLQKKYGLAAWAVLPAPMVTLAPKAT